MADPGDYETVLGQLGVYLARENARDIEIVDQGIFIAVSWKSDGIGHQQCFREEDLAHLQLAARFAASSTTNPAALFGALGRGLDEAQINIASITQDVDGFVVTGSCAGHYQRVRYDYRELRQIAAVPSAQRAPFVQPAATRMSPSGTWRAVPPPVAGASDSQISPITRRLQALQNNRP